MKSSRKKYKRSTIHYSETDGLILGFTETNSEIEDVKEFFDAEKVLQLEQVHGNKILFSDEIIGFPDGDGIILKEKNVIAAIRTADCTPLFFWLPDETTAGVIHIGWRGLHSKIGENLLNILRQKGTDTFDLRFFTGPAIEGKCYTVQKDVVDLFKDSNFSQKIFEKTQAGYLMDVTKGIELCLTGNGIPEKNITHSGICTFCNKNFPSYRRGDRENRIFNFIFLR